MEPTQPLGVAATAAAVESSWGALTLDVLQNVVHTIEVLPTHQANRSLAALRQLNRHYRGAVDAARHHWAVRRLQTEQVCC